MKLIEQLKRHEGYSNQPYLDTEGYTTIGYGFNIDAGVSKDLAECILRFQVSYIEDRLRTKYKWFKDLSCVRAEVLINMAFNLGIVGFGQFKKMIKAIEDGDNKAVVAEMLDSKWAHQVGKRSWELADQWRDDTYR